MDIKSLLRHRAVQLALVGIVALVVGIAIGGAGSSQPEPDDLTVAQRNELITSNDEAVRTSTRQSTEDDARIEIDAAYDRGVEDGKAEEAAAAIEAQQAAAAEEAAAAAEEAARGIGPGRLVVGTDIAPGRYQTEAGTDILDSCYWARLSSLDGSGIDSIIENGNAQGLTTIEVAPSDVVFETGCTWQPVG